LIGNPVLGENVQGVRSQGKRTIEIENQGPATAVTLKQGDIMDENELALGMK